MFCQIFPFRRKGIIAAALTALMFFAFGAVDVYAAPLDYALERAMERRLAIEKPDAARLSQLTYGREPVVFPMIQLWQNERAVTISADQAIADAELFFDLLRYVYGSYAYFGGDEVFLPIRDDVMMELARRDDLVVGMFSRMLFDALQPVVSDNHFNLDGRTFRVSYYFLADWTRRYGRSADGFFNMETGLYVADVIGHDKDRFFRLTADDDGNLFYAPMVHTGDVLAIYRPDIVYEDDSRDSLTLRRVATRWHSRDEEVYLHRVDGVPVLSLSRMGFDAVPEGGAGARRFLYYAEQLRGEDVIIIDIRSNGGGNGILPVKWMYTLTGQLVPSNSIWLSTEAYHPQGIVVTGTPETNQFYISADDIAAFFDPGGFNGFSTRRATAPRRIVENDQLLILLVDRFSASAAEAFADLFLNIENALIIGQNTAGIYNTDLTFPSLSLPHSGLPFGLGRSIVVHPQDHLPEGIGLAPDIWAMGDALEVALALLRSKD